MADPVVDILRNAPATDQQRDAAWSAFQSARTWDDLKAGLDKSGIPVEARVSLAKAWAPFAKEYNSPAYGKVQHATEPPVPGMEKIGKLPGGAEPPKPEIREQGVVETVAPKVAKAYKAWEDDYNSRIATMGGHPVSKTLAPISDIPVSPTPTGWKSIRQLREENPSDVVAGVASGVAKFGEGLVTPQNAVIAGTIAAAPPVAAAIANGYFTADMLKGMVEQSPELVKAAREKRWGDVAEIATQMAGTAKMLGHTGAKAEADVRSVGGKISKGVKGKKVADATKVSTGQAAQPPAPAIASPDGNAVFRQSQNATNPPTPEVDKSVQGPPAPFRAVNSSTPPVPASVSGTAVETPVVSATPVDVGTVSKIEPNAPVPKVEPSSTLLYQGVRKGRKGGDSSHWWTSNLGEALSFANREGPGGEVLVARVEDFPDHAFQIGDSDVNIPRHEYLSKHTQVSVDPSKFKRVPVEDLAKTESTIKTEDTNGPRAGESAGNAVDAGATGARQANDGAPSGSAGNLRSPETKVIIPGERTKYNARYEVRELDDVQPSHSGLTFSKNDKYAHRNDRQYDDPRNQKRIIEDAATFEPSLVVTDDPTSSNGPPIIDAEGNTIGGNSRVMKLQRVYQYHPNSVAAYRLMLAEKAAQFGVDPAKLAKMKQPVLVRVLDKSHMENPDTVARAVTDFNKEPTAKLTSSERGTADAKMVSPKTMKFVSDRMDALGDDATLAKALEGKAGPELIRKLVSDGVITEQETPQYLTNNGKVTPEAKVRISRMMTGRVFRDSEQYDSVPDSIRNKVERIAPDVARIAGRKGWDILPKLQGALDLLDEYDPENWDSIEQFQQQQGLFSSRQYGPEEVGLAKALTSDTPTALYRKFKQYAADAAEAEAGPQEGLDGLLPPKPVKTPDQALADAFGIKPNVAHATASKYALADGEPPAPPNVAPTAPSVKLSESGDGRPPRIYLGKEAMGLFKYLWIETFGGKAPNMAGVVMPQEDLYELSQNLVRNYSDTPLVRELSYALHRASKLGNGIIVNTEQKAVPVREVLRHELTHAEADKLSSKVFTRESIGEPFDALKQALIKRGYPKDIPDDLVVHEAIAHMFQSPDGWKALGITEQQAKDAILSVVNKAVDTHGEKGENLLRYAAAKQRQEIKRRLSEDRSGEDGTSNPGIQGGRGAGVRPSLEGDMASEPPRPRTSDSKTAIIKEPPVPNSKEPWQMTRAEYDGSPWESARTGNPITIFGYRGEGGWFGGSLSDRARAKFGRDFLLGDGTYVAPTENLASRFGRTFPVRVRLDNPYVMESANEGAIKRLDLEAIRKAGHDGIIIKSGQSGFGAGQESLRQVVVFPEYSEQVQRGMAQPTPSTVQKGARVRIVQVDGPPDYVAKYRGDAMKQVGKEGTVTNMSFGTNPKVKIGGKVYQFNAKEVVAVGGEHRTHVERALARGETVPSEVLVDYPDLDSETPSPKK